MKTRPFKFPWPDLEIRDQITIDHSRQAVESLRKYEKKHGREFYRFVLNGKLTVTRLK